MVLHTLEAPFAQQGTEVLCIHATHQVGLTDAELFVQLGGREQQRLLTLLGLAVECAEQAKSTPHTPNKISV